MAYKISYDPITGRPALTKDERYSIPFSEDNADFQDFLRWNAQQKIPLDYETTIAPTPPEKAETLDERISRIVSEKMGKAQ